jgi:tetratricopeptide (TPR) repeat protein
MNEPAFTRSASRADAFDQLTGPPAPTAGVKAQSPWRFALFTLVLVLVGYLAYRYFVWIPERQREASAGVEKAARANRGRAERQRAEALRAATKMPTDSATPDSAPTRHSAPVPATPSPSEVASPGAAATAVSRQESAARQDENRMQPVDPSGPARTAEPGERGGPKAPAPVELTESFDTYMSQGDRFRERDQPRSALDAYAKAAKVEPARAEPFAGRGLALLDLGKTAMAIAAFDRALKIDPRQGLALMGLAEAYRAEGNKDQAIRYYQRYLAVLPDGPEAPVAKAGIKAMQE